ncbi:MAG: putative TIM-barrel fold metal-dependent hydrolase [Verrucomicrobiaceae bacterium]|nr:putative TIM-barrel fold metal-dependent hydrolase [Verrucomicrobiaceae bacterium]
MIPRRDFLLTTLAATASAALALHGEASSTELIDANVWLGRWPIRDLPLAEPAALAAKLNANGVTRAWTSSFDGLMHKDIAGVNARLVESCRAHPIFEPFGLINLTLPRWEADIAECAKHRMRGIRLVPAYHGYKLDDARFVEALKLAASQRLVVQISCVLEDERTQNPLMRAAPVDVSPLAKALKAAPGARVMLLNWLQSMASKPVLLTLADTEVLFDIAMLEGIAGIEGALESISAERLCFGSYAPVFYHEAAKLKLRESELNATQLTAITHENAKRLLFA